MIDDEHKLPVTKTMEIIFDPAEVQFIKGQRGSNLLTVDGYAFAKNRTTEGRSYWLCSKKFSAKCHARVITELTKVASSDAFYLTVLSHNGVHTHDRDPRVATSIKSSNDEYTQIIMLPASGEENAAGKESQNYTYPSQYSVKQEKPLPFQPRPIKRESAPLQTSYSVPFHFVESGRRNQLLICEGQRYILNNKYGEKSSESGAELYFVTDKETQAEHVIQFSVSLRGKPAIMVDNIRFIVMNENMKRVLWRCSYMSTKTRKCPARVKMYRGNPPQFEMDQCRHEHMPLVRDYDTQKFSYVISQKGKPQLEHNGYVFVKEKEREKKVYWRCIYYTTKYKCRGRIHTEAIDNKIIKETPHCHKPLEVKTEPRRVRIIYFTGGLHFSKTQRGRTMLVYEGFRYVINRESQKNTFWRCNRYVKYGCRAGAVTSKCGSPDEQQTIRLTHTHSHSPEKLSPYEMEEKVEIDSEIK
ncbi:hypothetical protein PVAND_002503 [Polypedilum vanderplanki]|uniref:FLYWCH-type domain-containing protein n=1 Tax=Polypedilum vanderplanki TaxID=319348 RepID=A0A9J6BSC7_POLVA|nr:hypothetical protein PVAND_002503 [Polypedilum vanderplanki]